MQEDIQEQQVTLSDYIRVLYRGRWIISICFFIVVAATTYFTFTARPVYEASALVMIREEGSVKTQVFEVSSFIKRETMINNQVEILRSRTLAEDVIHRLEQTDEADSLWTLGNGADGNGSLLSGLKKFVLSILGQGNGGREPTEAEQFAELVLDFRESVNVAPKRDTDMIELKIESYSPWEAALVANTWMEAYRDLDISASRGEVGEVRKFLEQKLNDVRTELTAAEEELKAYKETENVAELGAETEQLIEQLASFETLYEAARTDLEANEKRLAFLKDQLDESQKAMVEEAAGLSSPVILKLEEQLGELIGRRAAMERQVEEAGLTEEYGQVNDMDLRIRGIQDKILEERQKMIASGGTSINPMAVSETIFGQILEIETENRSLTAKTNSLWEIVKQYQDDLNRLPEMSLKLARLQRETAVSNNIFMMLREKYEENRIAEAGQIGQVRIVDRASPPAEPIKPKKKMNILLGIMVGLGLGVGLTFLREYMDTSLKSIEDVERLGFPVLGSIPFITPDRASRHAVKDGGNGEFTRIESRLITHFAPKSPISEAYRTLRTNILYTRPDEPVKSVLISSSGPGEGKSTSVANLAITFAQMGANALIVDTDLRRPVLHGIFEVPRSDGLTNVLIGQKKLDDAVKKTKIENLDILTSGTLPPNPSEMLASKAMKSVVKEVTEKYDIVLFDSPPVIAVTDAAVLATQLDGLVLVIKSGETGKDALERSRVLMNNVNARVLGVMVNGVHLENMYGSYYYYYHYYYYGDGKDKKKKRARRALVKRG